MGRDGQMMYVERCLDISNKTVAQLRATVGGSWLLIDRHQLRNAFIIPRPLAVVNIRERLFVHSPFSTSGQVLECPVHGLFQLGD